MFNEKLDVEFEVVQAAFASQELEGEVTRLKVLRESGVVCVCPIHQATFLELVELLAHLASFSTIFFLTKSDISKKESCCLASSDRPEAEERELWAVRVRPMT